MSHVLTSSLSLQTTDTAAPRGPGPAQESGGLGTLLVLGAALVTIGGLGWFGVRRLRARRSRAAKEQARSTFGKRVRSEVSTPTTIVVQGTEVPNSPQAQAEVPSNGAGGGHSRAGRHATERGATERGATERGATPSGAGPSSAPPLPLAVRRSGPAEARGMGLKGQVDANAGRYSLSSSAPRGESTERSASSSPPQSDPIPRAPRVPSEVLPPPQEPLPLADGHLTTDGPRTQRGLGIPSPPPGFPTSPGQQSPMTTSQSRTVRGIGSLPLPRGSEPPWGNPLARTVRGIGPGDPLGGSSTPPREHARLSPPPHVHSGIPVGKETLKWGVSAPLFDEAGTPLGAPPAGASSSSTWPGGQARPSPAPQVSAVSVQRIRPSVPPRTKLAEHLRGVARELLARAATSGQVVLLSAPPRDAELLVRAAVELARTVGAECPGGVALAETDFERPRLQEWLRVEVPFGKGLSEQIHAVVRGGHAAPWTVLDAELGFHVLLEGRIRSPGLLWSQEFPEVIDALRRAYRLVLLVGPASPSSVDEQALRDVCDVALAITEENTPEKFRMAHWRHIEDKVIRILRLPVEG